MYQMRELQHAIADLLHQSPFYFYVLNLMERELTTKVPTAGVYVRGGKVMLSINPEFFFGLDSNGKSFVLKHECRHIINHLRIMNDKTLHDRKTEWNIAMDCSINQMDGDSELAEKTGGVTPKTLREMLLQINPKFNKEIELNEGCDYYYNFLVQELGEDRQLVYSFDDHSGLEDFKGQLPSEILKQMIRKAKHNAQKAGNLPGDLSEILDKIFESKRNWKSLLQNLVTSSIITEKESTRRRRNRRYGITYAGKKKVIKPNLAVVVDTSVSMCPQLLGECWGEIAKIQKTFTDYVINVIQCDTEVQSVETFDLKKKPVIKGRGGTDMNKGFEQAKELDCDVVICLTDGFLYEEVVDPKLNTIWVVKGNDEFKPRFGKVLFT